MLDLAHRRGNDPALCALDESDLGEGIARLADIQELFEVEEPIWLEPFRLSTSPPMRFTGDLAVLEPGDAAGAIEQLIAAAENAITYVSRSAASESALLALDDYVAAAERSLATLADIPTHRQPGVYGPSFAGATSVLVDVLERLGPTCLAMAPSVAADYQAARRRPTHVREHLGMKAGYVRGAPYRPEESARWILGSFTSSSASEIVAEG